jgi:hypothetical protein
VDLVLQAAAGEALTAKQAPHWPGTTPALGLRAGSVVAPIVSQTALEKENAMMFCSLIDSLKRRRNPKRSPRPGTCRLAVESLEDRRTPTAMLVIGDATILESNDGTRNALVTVSLTEPHGNVVTVNYRTADGTASAGSDYHAVAGKLTFAKNEMSKTISVPVIGDRVPEPDEYFFVRLASPKGANIADGEAVVSIVDASPRIRIMDAYSSGGPTVTFTVSLSHPYDELVTVNFATADGTAIAGVDYVASSGTLTFDRGETTKTITIQVLNTVSEPDKYLYVRLSGASSNARLTNDSTNAMLTSVLATGYWAAPASGPVGYLYWMGTWYNPTISSPEIANLGYSY